MQRLIPIIVLPIALLAPGCPSAPRLRSASRSIDASGGSLELGTDALVITVPAGALAAPISLEVRDVPPTEVAAPFPEGTTRSGLFALTPHGTTFAAPVSIAIRHWGSAEGLSVLRLDDEDDDTWEPVAGVRYESNVARFEVRRLSILTVYGPAAGPQCFGSPECSGCLQVSGSDDGVCAEDDTTCESGWDLLCVEETGYGYALLCCPE